MMYRMPWWLGNNDWGYHPYLGGFILLAVWSVVWTGLALWHAAKRDEKGWFIFFLVVHTAGIVELIYLILVVKAFASSPKHSPPRRRKK